MSHVFQIPDDAYAVLEAAAAERGQSVEALFQSWVDELRRAVSSQATAEHDPAQDWFWTAEWQADEQQVEADKAAGRFTRYESNDAFLKSFEDDDDDEPDADV